MTVTPFDQSEKSPWPIGKVPRAGWFAIEPACTWSIKDAPCLAAILGIEHTDDDVPVFTAVLDESDLKAVANAFDLAATDGRGLLVTEDHSFFNPSSGSSRAIGWIKALHYADGNLWAWIEWTPAGHQSMDGGEFAFFSTEYEYTDFTQNEDGTITPKRLAGLSVTNCPNHTGQIPVTNTKMKNTMNKKPAPGKVNKNSTVATVANDDDTTDVKVAVDGDEKKVADTNTDPEKDDVDMNDEAVTTLEDIAAMLELDETATVEDIRTGIQALITRNDELEAALAAANESGGTDTNTRRFPNLFGKGKGRQTNTKLKGDPPKDSSVIVGGKKRQVNSQEADKVKYCNNQINELEKKKGRQLSSSEFTAAMRKADQEYRAGAR